MLLIAAPPAAWRMRRRRAEDDGMVDARRILKGNMDGAVGLRAYVDAREQRKGWGV